MPRRLNREFVKREFDKYGYTLPPDFTYTNNSTTYRCYDEVNGRYVNISYKQLRYKVEHGVRQEYIYPNPFEGMEIDTEETKPNTSFDRWDNARKDDVFISSYGKESKETMFNYFKKTIKTMMKKKDFTMHFDEQDKILQLKGFIEACKVAGPNIDKSIRLTITDGEGRVTYRHLSAETIKYLDTLFTTDEFDRIHDSMDDIVENILDVVKIDVEFVERKQGKRIIAEFFPYLNKSDIDLRRYGIFKSQKEEGFNDPCLIQAFMNSGIFTDDEMKMLKSFIKTRAVAQTELKEISELMKVHIHCKKLHKDSGKTSHVDFGMEYKHLRSINLIIIDEHYLLNERLNVSECYIKRYEEINKDNRFKNQGNLRGGSRGQGPLRKTMLLKFDDKRYSFSKKGLKIIKLIKLMIEHNLLLRMSEKDINKYSYNFKAQTLEFDGKSRKVVVEDKKDSTFKRLNKVPQTKHFFGYTPEDDESPTGEAREQVRNPNGQSAIDERLKEIQEVVDRLKLRKNINVKLYYKFSELMQKIMYEYGCFDDVYELCGINAKRIRDECVFPKTRTFNDKSFYSNEKLYYIDLNGAYMSAVKYIPTGEKGEGHGVNTKIKDLIEKLYEERMKAKENGNDKLAKTLKFLMTSCWGYSIKRPKLVKHKYTKNVNSYVETFAPFVIGYNYNDDGVSGFVDTVNSFVPHYTIPQFARSVLVEFKKMMDEVKKLVTVYYENVDAILISESDYNKLVELGYVGNELGKFKIEHVFTEIAIKSSKRYVGMLENGEKYYHCVKNNVDYEEFVNDVKNSC